MAGIVYGLDFYQCCKGGMKSYKELIQEIWKLNRVHVSDDMDLALKRTSEFYEGSRLISYPSGTAIGGGGSWTVPDLSLIHI